MDRAVVISGRRQVADRRSPEYHLKTVLLAVIFVVALAAGVAILSFGLTRMFGIRKRPDRTASLSVRLPPRESQGRACLET